MMLMHRRLTIALSAAGLIAAASRGGMAQTTPAPTTAAPAATPVAAPAPPPTSDLNFFQRFYKAYADEWGAPPASDPNAPPSRRPPPFPPQPQTSPPMPFTEWPFGGGNPIGATVPSSIDSPLMTALAPTALGQFLNDWHTQIYGWINPGFNVSTSSRGKGGNFPAAYAYDPNTIWLDQAVVLFERLPDTVQQDHVDWGFRISPIYGETYRYTTALGFASYQLQHKNQQAGFDVPMIYAELYVPGILQGVIFRLGRYISVPDIEAQLAPNNYMYSHSMTYAYDNYTNTGLLTGLQVTRNLLLEAGIVVGTDSAGWDASGVKLAPSGSPWSNADPGVQPTATACARYQTDSAYDTIYSCLNGINGGNWGYNNLQQYTTTFYHKFNEQWHLSTEAWWMHENKTPNAAAYGEPNQTAGNFGNLGNLLNGPFGAWCHVGHTYCTSNEFSLLAYLNYSWNPLDNLSLRAEFFNDNSGQRTGVRDQYLNYAIGWQHWFSPTVMIRPEVAVYNALQRKAFNRNGQGNIGSPDAGGPTAMSEAIVSADLIWHF
jgi:Putative beta-barrel porin-2, OmpL-like. bbp2